MEDPPENGARALPVPGHEQVTVSIRDMSALVSNAVAGALEHVVGIIQSGGDRQLEFAQRQAAYSQQRQEERDNRDHARDRAHRDVPRGVQCPKFSGQKDASFTWLTYKSAFLSYKLTAKLTEEEAKLVVHAHLTGEAALIASAYGPASQWFRDARGYEGYITLLDGLFQPASESSLL